MYRDINADTYFDYYKIETGDSLYKIAKKYNINPNLLASVNGLNINDYIYPNQVLIIPNINYSYYITSKNDTLENVLNKLNIKYDELIKYNKNIYLMEGQMIVKKNN